MELPAVLRVFLTNGIQDTSAGCPSLEPLQGNLILNTYTATRSVKHTIETKMDYIFISQKYFYVTDV